MCVPVEPELAKESPVLDTLMEFEGLVEMPQGVSLDDFERWATIVTEDPSKLDLTQLGFALRVRPASSILIDAATISPSG